MCFYTRVTGQKELLIPLISGDPGPASHLRENWQGAREEPLALEQKTAGPPSEFIPVSEWGGMEC